MQPEKISLKRGLWDREKKYYPIFKTKCAITEEIKVVINKSKTYIFKYSNYFKNMKINNF